MRPIISVTKGETPLAVETDKAVMEIEAPGRRPAIADIAGATFTISNLGMYGVDALSAILTPPQAAILAVGSIADRMVSVASQPGIRPMMTLTLSWRPPGRR